MFTLFRQSVLAEVKWVWNCCNEAQQYNRQIIVSISSASQGVSRQRRSLDMQQTSETYLDDGTSITSDCRHKLKARGKKSKLRKGDRFFGEGGVRNTSRYTRRKSPANQIRRCIRHSTHLWRNRLRNRHSAPRDRNYCLINWGSIS